MKHLKYLMPVAALALVTLFGCDSDSNSTEANTKYAITSWYATDAAAADH